jgi:uncharacterized protein (TIGR03067 family)
MKPVLSLSIVFAAVLVGSTTFAEDPKGDLANLQGTWSAKVGPDKNIPVTVVVKNTKIELKVTRPDEEEITLTAELKIDEKTIPKSSDWLKLTGPDGQEIGDNKGIYKLEGDTWTTCTGGPGNDRPTKFEAGEGGPPNLTVWTRVKPKVEEKPKADLDKIQGTWTAPAGPNEEVIITLTVKDKAYTAKWDRGDGTNVELKGEIKVDEKASPKVFDFIKTQRNDGDDARDNLGIYTFDGEKLKICVGMPGNDRPTEFKKGDEGAPMLLIFTRSKD